MRTPILLVLSFLALNIATDWYIFHQISARCRDRRFWRTAHLSSCILLFLVMLAGLLLPAREGNDHMLLTKMWLLFGYLSVYLAKYVGVIFDLIASVPRLLHRRRCRAMTITGIICSAVFFVAIWWGALINRFNINRNEVDVHIPELPAQFEGYRIVQFSDIHVGSFNSDTTFVSEIVDSINAASPDLIVFTGDIVNRKTAEISPFIKTFSRLNAPDGAFAILGNHDYGDYMTWSSSAAKTGNMEDLYSAYRETGMRLLRNETVWLRRGSDSIALIGVENIGDPPFPVYGSLQKAYPRLGDRNTKILLSHNPAHWVDSIRNRSDVNVSLTLSGHTHAMQIEVLGLSPAAFRYATWGGLYDDYSKLSSGPLHQLYVNIGCGTVGLPMRLGATPEITVLTLHCK